MFSKAFQKSFLSQDLGDQDALIGELNFRAQRNKI